MKRKIVYLFLCINIILYSCTTNAKYIENELSIRYRVIDCPIEIRESAVFYAHQYAERENEFTWGRRDYLENDGILQVDCSGLIVRIFQYAVNGTNYSLLFRDAPLSAFHEYFTIPIDISMATPGDIIFMGTDRNFPPSHMAVFASIDDENIYFIDSTLKPEDGINGVTLRFYPKDDERFLSFARLLVSY